MLDALAAPRDAELRARLGPELDDELRRLLRARTLAWARGVARADPHELRRSDQLTPALAGHDGPVLIVAPDVPGLGAHHVEGARDDLAAGIVLTVAPATDGHLFLLALAHPEPALLDLATASFDELILTVTAVRGGVGMLRPERRLSTVADARALAADPSAPAELRALARLAIR